MRRYRLIHQIALLCTLLLCATQSWSHAKTDLITVANGDQITGAVCDLSVSAGTINIKWRDVKQIERDLALSASRPMILAASDNSIPMTSWRFRA